jgi:ABC-type glycerol-3-phosphate transport system substrate-binding protein
VWDESLPNSTQLFANGKLAFYFGPSWRVFNIEEMKIPGLNYEITTMPQLQVSVDMSAGPSSEAELTDIHWATFWVESVNKNSKKQKEAWKFVEFLSQKENLEKLYMAASQTRAFGEIYPRVSMQDQMIQNPKIAPFVKAANNATSWYLCSRTFDGVSGVNEEMIKYFGDAINAITLKQVEASTAMVDLQNGINQIKERFKL